MKQPIELVPEILCHPNIPKPLHGVNPRTIFGKKWWDTQRHLAYEQFDFHCAACGVHKKDALFHQWLEAHEFYLFDYLKGRITFDHLVPLCHACHNYIHDGRMEMLVARGEMTLEKQQVILTHGDMVIAKAGLTTTRANRHKTSSQVAWKDWRLVVKGKEYGPSTLSSEEWLAGKWRNWSPSRTEKPLYCCECKKTVQAYLTTGEEIYPTREDLHDQPFWKCPDCKNYVGCHHKTNNPNRPLGNIPTPALRMWRKMIHEQLDPLWKSGAWDRQNLYKWIGKELKREFHVSHIATVKDAEATYKLIQRIPKTQAEADKIKDEIDRLFGD